MAARDSYSGWAFSMPSTVQNFTCTLPSGVSTSSILRSITVRSMTALRIPTVEVSSKITLSMRSLSDSEHMTDSMYAGRPFFMKTGV